jgi:uncharacterized protein
MDTTSEHLSVPLFPLHAVLFPQGWLSLRIFEARYLDMVSWCMRNDSPFGVCLIRDGQELETNPTIYPIGTLAVIRDWHRRDDGLLGIMVEGTQRFQIMSQHLRPNRLLEGTLSLIPPDTKTPLAQEFSALSQLLQKIFRQIGPPYDSLDFHAEDTVWLSNRLAELLPMSLARRHFLLAMEDAVARLHCVQEVLEELDIRY